MQTARRGIVGILTIQAAPSTRCEEAIDRPLRVRLGRSVEAVLLFIPVHDDNPLKSIPFQYVTVTLIAINVGVFVFTAMGIDPALVSSFAVRPNELFLVNVVGGSAPVSNDLIAVPEAYTLVSYMFFHGDIWHLVGNMLFLWVFGDNVEDAVGHIKFLFL